MLRFRQLSELKNYLADVLKRPHENLGHWSTAQIFYHLAAAFEASVAPTPLPPGYPKLFRRLARCCRWYVLYVRFPRWLPIPAAIEFKLKPPEQVELTEQFQRLIRAIEQFENHQDSLPPHPVLGKLSPKQWQRFHLRHCEHHLSFVRFHRVVASEVSKRIK